MKKCCEFCGGEIEKISRRTKKYCSDNCKQLAYYSRHGMKWGRNSSSQFGSLPNEIPVTVKPDFTVKENDRQESKNQSEFVQWLKVKEDALQEKQPLPVLNVKPDVKEPLAVKQYHYIDSPILISITQFREESNAESIFSNPESYWTNEAIESAQWVSIRLRCLLENILRLSHYKFIDRKTLLHISDALNDLSASYYFRGISRSYSFADLIIGLKDRFVNAVKQIHGNEIPLRLSLKRKAEFMAARFALASITEKVGFSQLNFSDGIREEVLKEFNRK